MGLALTGPHCDGCMMENTKLKRVYYDGMPEAILLLNGAIRFRHYLISLHAMDRFVQRHGKPAIDMVPLLHEAVMAYTERCRHPAIRRVISIAERRGGYVLKNKKCFFIVSPDNEYDLHVVTTVMTINDMIHYHPSIQLPHTHR